MEDLITLTEAARMRGVSHQAVVELVKRGRLTRVEVGGRPFVSKKEVEAFKPERAGRKGKAAVRGE